ncbi:MAG: PilZ domain-containing protein [Thiohalomonadales bacterium]
MLTELSFLPIKPSSKEQRRLKRWQLVNYLRVFDAIEGKLLGHLVDVSKDGIMILSSEPLVCGREYKLRMERLSNSEFTHFELTAIGQWSKIDQDPHLHNTGCLLVDPGEEALACLQLLMDELRADHDE